MQCGEYYKQEYYKQYVMDKSLVRIICIHRFDI